MEASADDDISPNLWLIPSLKGKNLIPSATGPPGPIHIQPIAGLNVMQTTSMDSRSVNARGHGDAHGRGRSMRLTTAIFKYSPHHGGS